MSYIFRDVGWTVPDSCSEQRVDLTRPYTYMLLHIKLFLCLSQSFPWSRPGQGDGDFDGEELDALQPDTGVPLLLGEGALGRGGRIQGWVPGALASEGGGGWGTVVMRH